MSLPLKDPHDEVDKGPLASDKPQTLGLLMGVWRRELRFIQASTVNWAESTHVRLWSLGLTRK